MPVGFLDATDATSWLACDSQGSPTSPKEWPVIMQGIPHQGDSLKSRHL